MTYVESVVLVAEDGQSPPEHVLKITGHPGTEHCTPRSTCCSATPRSVTPCRRPSMPERIQRQRTKGWRMPKGAVYVGRPTRWGNPFLVGGFVVVHADETEQGYDVELEGDVGITAAQAVAGYRDLLHCRTNLFEGETDPSTVEHVEEWRAAVESLRGHDLVCWCPLDQPCHADVLLKVANR